MLNVTYLDDDDEKSDEVTTSLLQQLVLLCEKDSISSASKWIEMLYADPDTFPSELFTPQTDNLLPPAIIKIVSILEAKDSGLWVWDDFFFLTQLMNLACGPAMVDKQGGNREAERWLDVMSACFTELPRGSWPLIVWLFTFSDPHDTLLESALQRLDIEIYSTGDMTREEAKEHRNRILSQFERQQLTRLNVQCAGEFGAKLKEAAKCERTFCRVRRVITKCLQKVFCVGLR